MIVLEHNRRYLYQWDLDRRIQIDNFPPGTWVEFSHLNDRKNSAVITAAYEEAGHVYANIPNVLLQIYGYLHICVQPSATDARHSPEQKDIKVVWREKPEEYIYKETEVVSYKTLEKRILKLENELDEQAAAAVEKYLQENPIDGVQFETNETLILKDGILSVNTTDETQPDNTLPITSAGVYAAVGNIEALLKTI